MSLTVTDILKFRDNQAHPWQNLLIEANINFNLIYPVGSIYMSTVNVNPATLFGGTWEQLEDTFLLAAGTNHTAGSTGGEETHVLTTGETPAHTHTRGTMEITGSYRTSWADASGGGIINNGEYSGALKGVHNGNAFFTPASMTSAEVRHLNWLQLTASDGWTGETSSVGSDQAHNNMPPYLAVYMWKRLTLSPSLTPLPMNVLGDVASEDIVPVSKGGTGADNAASARANLGMNATIVPITDPAPSLSGWFMQGQLTFDPGANTVRIYLVCRASANIATSQPIGIIPEPYRPKTQKNVFCYEKMDNNATQIAYPGVVETNGNVRQTGTNAALECLVVGEYSLD